MTSGFRIGKLFGINIRVDWSWLLIFILITWNLAAVFGQVQPGWGPGLIWGLAVGAALLFFASVLAHELAHSLVAQARGLPVRSITLFLFGGVSNIEREPGSPGAEFLMAIVGPATSIVLGALFLWLSGALGMVVGTTAQQPGLMLGQLDPLSALFAVLGVVNITVGIFNMIPGFPLDGGRVVRSILWAITGNLKQATRWAAGLGQALAWLLIIAGISMAFGAQIPLFGTGLVGGIWLAFIGWFLNTAATQSYQRVLIQDMLEGVPIARIMRTDPAIISPSTTVNELVYDHVMRSDDYAFPVVEGERLMGIVTLRDVRDLPRDRWPETFVSEIMTATADLVVLSPREDTSDALNKLIQRDVRQLPVIDNGRFVGLLRRADIMRWMQLHSDEDIE
jgi:Zn-dependent protease